MVVKLGVYGFLRMTTLLFVEQAPAIGALLVALGIVGVVYGGLGAIGTHNAKRMLAYSTLAQIGFILVAIGWGTPLALAAAVIFTVNHSLVKAAMLMLAGVVASRAPVKTASFEVVQGLGKYMPGAGALFLVGGLALAGIPPTNGFISKMTLFQSGIQAEQWWSLLLLGLASIFTLIYVMRAFMRIWWQPVVGFSYGATHLPGRRNQGQTRWRPPAGPGPADRQRTAAGHLGRAAGQPGHSRQPVAGRSGVVHTGGARRIERYAALDDYRPLAGLPGPHIEPGA